MASFDLKLNNDEFAALAMAAHLEDMTLNDYVVSCLISAAQHEIARLEKELETDLDHHSPTEET